MERVSSFLKIVIRPIRNHNTECTGSVQTAKSYKSPGIDQILTELIKAGGKTIRCEIHKLIISIWNKEELREEWK